MRITLLSGGCGQNKVEPSQIKVLRRVSASKRVTDERSRVSGIMCRF